jgi:hypothetical protein
MRVLVVVEKTYSFLRKNTVSEHFRAIQTAEKKLEVFLEVFL